MEPDVQSPSFREVMQKHAVPLDLQDLLVQDDFDTPSFAHIAHSMVDLDSVITQLNNDLGRELNRREVAGLRACWRYCQEQLRPSAPASSSQAATAAPVPTAPSWAEAFPQKLASDQLQQVQLAFEAAYPSEILDTHTTPGPRLMALTHHQLSKKEWKWIPWSIRLSQHQHDTHSASRPKKVAKLESLSVQDLILDDIPNRELPHQLGIAQLTQILMLQAVAIALCKGAHLHGLKQYAHKFIRIASTRYDSDSGLRGPNTQEMMAADQAIWSKISELYNLRAWTLDDCVHEFVEIRSDLESLLQPRPSLKASASVATSVKGKGKSKTAKGKGWGNPAPAQPSGKGSMSRRVQWITELIKENTKHTICIRFNQGLCQDPNCKYLHVCCVAKTNGQPCAQAHTAMQHSQTPH